MEETNNTTAAAVTIQNDKTSEDFHANAISSSCGDGDGVDPAEGGVKGVDPTEGGDGDGVDPDSQLEKNSPDDSSRLNELVFLPNYKVEKILSKKQVVHGLQRALKRKMIRSTDNLLLNWGHSFLKSSTLWSYENGTLTGKGVKVAVLDTGIDPFHRDFTGAIDAGMDFTGVRSWVDGNGHGTHCCGIIGARLNFGNSVGVAPECKLVVGKVLSDEGSGSFLSIINGIEWAVKTGANVISLSLGAQMSTIPTFLKNVIDNAISKGVIVVVAAGNEGRIGVGVPGSYTRCVTVGACRDMFGNIAPFSSVGSAVDIVAPGVNIYSTYKNGSYAYMSGTSMATPFVAGVAALFVQACRILGIVPNQSLFENYIQRTAIDRGARGKDDFYGFGCLNTISLFDSLYKFKANPPPSSQVRKLLSSTVLDASSAEEKEDFFAISWDDDDDDRQNYRQNYRQNRLPIVLNSENESGLYLSETHKTDNLRIYKFVGVDENVIFMRLVKGLLSPEEADEIILQGQNKLAPSLVRTERGKIEPDARRTSKTGIFEKSETELIERLEKRITSLFNLPQSFLEPIQILKYEKNQKYDFHYDAVHNLSTPENIKFFERGYQRILSVFVYLKDSEPCKNHKLSVHQQNTSYQRTPSGGDIVPIAGMFKTPLCSSTHFTNLNLSINGKKGDAVIWTNTDSSRKVIKEALHQGTALCQGEKWALNFWIHGRDAPTP